MTALAKILTCASCSRASVHGSDNWRDYRSTVTTGSTVLHMGRCPQCLNLTDANIEQDPDECDTNCGGIFQSKVGTYYRAVVGEGIYQETWECWDRACVENWLSEQDSECDQCGGHLDMDIVEVAADGKTKRVGVR